MNITREQTGENTATIRVEIVPEDYREPMNKTLRDYQKKANIPGFRPGHVPAGLIKKMYGKALMADEINKLLSEGLTGYLKDEALKILGNALPNKERTQPARFEDNETLEFFFDIGFAPKITLPPASELELTRYTIQIDDKMVDGYIEDTRKRFPVITHPEQPGPEDSITGLIREVDPSGNPVEGAEPVSITVNPGQISDETIREQWMGLTHEQDFVFNPTTLFGSPGEAEKILKLPKILLEKPEAYLSFMVSEFNHQEPSELNEAFFSSVYPDETFATAEDFRERVRKDAAESFRGETDKLFFQDAIDTLVKNVPVTLPDTFLKKWLYEQEDHKLSLEEVEQQYPVFAESMKWQLIENQLIKENQIDVTDDDIRGYIRSYLLRQVNTGFVDPEMEQRYETIVDAFMKNEEQVRKINDQLYNAKLMQVFMEKFPLKQEEISHEEYIKLASSRHHDHHDHPDHHAHHDHHD